MKTSLKVIILFLIVFNFRIPYFYDTAVLSVIISLLYYIIVRRSIPFYQFNSRYVVTILAATVAMICIVMLITVFHGRYDFTLYMKRFTLQLFMLFALATAYPLMIEGKEEQALEETLKIICYTFAWEGAIHLTGFIYNPFGEWLIRLLSEDRKIVDSYVSDYYIHRFRFYAMSGSVFFELPAAMGVACIVYFRLLLERGQKYMGYFISIVVLMLLLAGIMLSGRTGFIGLFTGLLYYIVFMSRSGWKKDIWRLVAASALLGFIFYSALSDKQKNDFNEQLLPFALEGYYNWKEYGTFFIRSADVTMDSHYFPLKAETIQKGHGVEAMSVPFYRHTDAGYMNALVFGGIFYLLALVAYQCLYFIKPLSLARLRVDANGRRRDFWFFTILLAYMFVMEYKGVALGSQHLTEVVFLFICSAYITQHYFREDYGQDS
ncbi:MAG: hypothetical protein LBB73_01245 [Dysgonamonadaceae bacterium]|jgi:hypothetical protein|nr:hypothetical protein [Dysgonamonadaceae bacterium]